MYQAKYLPIIALVIAWALTGCVGEQSGKKRSTGTTNELLIVTNTKNVWKGPVGDSIRAYFGKTIPAMPQEEPEFNFLNIAEKDLNDLYKKMHNIFIVDINPSFSQTIVETKRDLWSEPQRVIKITAPDTTAFFSKFEEQKEAYFQLFEKLERERIINNFRMAQDIRISNMLVKDFDIFLEIPGGFSVSTKSDDHVWMRHTVTKVKQDVELGVLITRVEYTDTSMFSPDQIIGRRDRFTKELIAGPSRGSYMKVADEYIQPVFNLVEGFPVEYVVETRGLWDLENDFMGGPFISYTFVHPRNRLLYTLDGYIYYPNQNKRNHLRELEAIFYKVEIPEQKAIE
jgi:hypothetical protein